MHTDERGTTMVSELIARMTRQHCPRCETTMDIEAVGSMAIVYACPVCGHRTHVASTPDWSI